MQLTINHRTTYGYDDPITHAVMRLRLFPSAFDSQKVESWKVTVNDTQVRPNHTDAFGIPELVWSTSKTLDKVFVVAEGTINRTEDSGIVRGLDDRMPPAVFLRTSDLTTADDDIAALADDSRREATIDTLHSLSEKVREAIAYAPDTTDMATSAAEALAASKGVCQDHAHVFIAAARCLGIPARYVAGYYDHGNNFEHSETHGWAEGYVENLGWVGFDITNRTCPTPAHVRVTCGMDAPHAGLIIGTQTSGSEETITADVTVTEGMSQQQSMGGQSQSQSQGPAGGKG